MYLLVVSVRGDNCNGVVVAAFNVSVVVCEVEISQNLTFGILCCKLINFNDESVEVIEKNDKGKLKVHLEVCFIGGVQVVLISISVDVKGHIVVLTVLVEMLDRIVIRDIKKVH